MIFLKKRKHWYLLYCFDGSYDETEGFTKWCAKQDCFSCRNFNTIRRAYSDDKRKQYVTVSGKTMILDKEHASS